MVGDPERATTANYVRAQRFGCWAAWIHHCGSKMGVIIRREEARPCLFTQLGTGRIPNARPPTRNLPHRSRQTQHQLPRMVHCNRPAVLKIGNRSRLGRARKSSAGNASRFKAVSTLWLITASRTVRFSPRRARLQSVPLLPMPVDQPVELSAQGIPPLSRKRLRPQ
jgi:hypothetical protein